MKTIEILVIARRPDHRPDLGVHRLFLPGSQQVHRAGPRPTHCASTLPPSSINQQVEQGAEQHA